MNTKFSIVFIALFCLAASAGVAVAKSIYEVSWYESEICYDNSKCACSEVSGYVKGSEAAKQTIAPLPNKSWQTMAINNMNLNPFGACTMVLTALNCGYQKTSYSISTESASVEVPCASGRAYVEYKAQTGFRVNFQEGFF